MRPHNQATMSFGKLALGVLAVVMGAGLAGAFGDGKTPSPDVGKLFQVHDAPAKKAKKPPPSSDPQAVTCSEDGQQCWFTDQGQPNR